MATERKRREKRAALWSKVEAGANTEGMVNWPDIEAAIHGAARRGKTAREYAAFWGVTIRGARDRLRKLVELKLATVSRCPSSRGQLADHYEIKLPA